IGRTTMSLVPCTMRVGCLIFFWVAYRLLAGTMPHSRIAPSCERAPPRAAVQLDLLCNRRREKTAESSEPASCFAPSGARPGPRPRLQYRQDFACLDVIAPAP